MYFNPYSEAQFRVFLPEGDHLFRVGFINDEFPKTLAEKDSYQKKKNKYLETMRSSGPFPSNVEKASRKKILICDPNSGPACVERIVATLARRAYRRPVTKSGSRLADEVRRAGKGERRGRGSRNPAGAGGDAGLAAFSVPHGARSRSDRRRRKFIASPMWNWLRA